MLAYTPAHIRKNAQVITEAARAEAPAEPIDGPVKLKILFRFPFKAGERKTVLQSGRAWKDTKPDLGNLEKQVEDCLEAAGWIVNDSRIVWRESAKVRSATPGLTIVLSRVTEDAIGESENITG